MRTNRHEGVIDAYPTVQYPATAEEGDLMTLWLFAGVFWLLAMLFVLGNMPSAVALCGIPALVLTGVAVFRSVLRWVGRQVRGDH